MSKAHTNHHYKTRKLFAYMTARAKYERTEHTLTIEWYESHFCDGIRRFFNVSLDDNGNILGDSENKTFWKLYQQ
jgi:hypothetical protein